MEEAESMLFGVDCYPSHNGARSGARRLAVDEVVMFVAMLATVGVSTLFSSAAYVALGALVVGVAVILIARTVDRTLQLLVASAFLESLGFGSFRIGRVLSILVVLVLAYRLTLTPWRPSRWAPLAGVPVMLYAAWILASGYWAQESGGWSFAVGQLGLALAFFLGFALLVQKPEQLTRLLRTFVVGAFAASLVGIVQGITGSRAVGLQGDPNLYALYQVAAIPAAFALARQSLHYRRWWALAAIPLVGSVVASQSRGGLLATIVVVLFMILRGEMRTREVRRPHPINSLIGLAAIVAVGVAISTYVPRFNIGRISVDRGSGRLDIWYAAWRAFLQHPLIGIGGGDFKPTSIHLLQTTPGVQLIRGHLLLIPQGIETHNLYLETVTEYGVIGAVTYVLLLVASFRSFGWARRHLTESTISALGPMLLAFIVASTFLSVANSKLLWMLVGLSVALRSMSARDDAVESSPNAPMRAAAGRSLRSEGTAPELRSMAVSSGGPQYYQLADP